MGSHEQSHDASGALDLPRNTLIKRRNQQQQLRQSDPLKCPRCDSTNTKFCYYNNYNKSQPRHFCKACKRHWTDGGTLRNVPVGGGGKNKRMKTSDTAMVSTTAAKLADASCKNRNNDSGNFLFPVGGGENMPGTAPNVCSSINFNGINLDGESGTSNDLQMPSSESVSLEGSQCLISSTLANRSEEMGIGCLHTCLSGSTLSDEPSALMTSATSTSVDMPYCNLDWEDICRFALADLGMPYDDAEIFMP